MKTDKSVESAAAEEVLRAKINLETSRINWHDLQSFYAKGLVVGVSKDLDIVDVALQLTLDNKPQFESWQKAGLVIDISDEQALKWYDNKTDLWAVVVRPWILVQDK